MATKQELEDRVVELEAQLAAGTGGVQVPTGKSDEEVEVLLSQAKADLETRLKKADLEIEQLKKNKHAGGLVLNGVPHDIIRQERMVDMAGFWRRREVADDDTALIVAPSKK